MLNNDLSLALENALIMEEHYRTKLLYWRYERQRLEQQIETDSTRLIDEVEAIARGAWDNGFFGN